MLVATINPPAKKIIQNSPFSATQEFSGDKMIVKCTRLLIGASSASNDDARFDIRFGKVKYEKNPDGSQGNPILEILLSYSCNLTQAEMANWGTDDTVVYDLIAQKLGFQIVSLEEVPGLHFTL